MNSLTQKVRVKLIQYGYCPESVDLEIIPWLNLRRLQSGGRLEFKSNFEICKDKVSLTCRFQDRRFLQKLVNYSLTQLKGT
jgi:hypothetical protein